MSTILLVICYIILVLILLAFVKYFADRHTTNRYPCTYREDESYDYIIVGLGTAGAVITRRLAESNPHAKILVLERGLDESNSEEVYNNSKGSIAAYTAPYSEVLTNESSSVPITIASMVGGGSSHNYGLVVYGTIHYYSEEYPNLAPNKIHKLWRRVNRIMNTSYLPTHINLFNRIIPFIEYVGHDPNWYRRIQTLSHSINTYNNVGDLRASTRFSNIIATSMKESINHHLPLLENYNTSASPTGVCIDNELFVNYATGLRSSADVAYLKDDFVRQHCNLTVVLGAHVKSIIRTGDKTTATSVEWEMDAKKYQDKLKPTGKVILTAGAIYSPYLLLKSGFNFEAIMSNHYGTTLIFRVPLSEIGSDFSSGPLAFIKTSLHALSPVVRARDWQIIVGGSSLLNTNLVPIREEGWVYVTLLLWLLNPRVKGSVKLSSINDDKPVIDFPMFSDGDLEDPNSDLSQCYEGMLYMKQVYDNMNEFCNKQILFPPDEHFLTSHSDKLIQDIKTGVSMTDHYSTTCANAINSVSQANPLATRETSNVYVADASSFTYISDGNTEFPTLVRAEYAADLFTK